MLRVDPSCGICGHKHESVAQACLKFRSRLLGGVRVHVDTFSPHLSLGGVDVDVEVPAGHGYPQVDEGVRVLREDVLVCGLNGLLDRRAFHQAVVDEQDEVRPLKKERARTNTMGQVGLEEEMRAGVVRREGAMFNVKQMAPQMQNHIDPFSRLNVHDTTAYTCRISNLNADMRRVRPGASRT